MSDDKQKEHLQKIFSLRYYKSLYKYFSSEIFLGNWKKVRNQFGLEDENKKIIIKNLVDTENDGYKYLELADKADFVQRDALYFGTVRLDISPKHLYGPGLLEEESNFFSVDERKLLENSLDYLRERFYESDKARWVSGLLEKIIAYLVLNKSFKMKWLEKYDDPQFRRLITNNMKPDTKKARLPKKWTNRAKELLEGNISFSLIFKLLEIDFERNKSIIDIEHNIIQTRESFRMLVKYPFKKGLLLDISHVKKLKYPVHFKYRGFSVALFQDDKNRNFNELLKIIQKLCKYCSVTHSKDIREGIGRQLSWTNVVRINNKNVVKAVSEAILIIEEKDKAKRGTFLAGFLKDLTSIKTFSPIWHNFENIALWYAPIMQYVEEHNGSIEETDILEKFAKMIFSLPLRLLQYRSTKKNLDRIYKTLLEMIPEAPSNEKKGHLFEALFLVEKMRKKRGSFQFLISNLIVVDPTKEKRKRDVAEFDVIEFIINGNNKSECRIYACSIGDDYKQKNEEKIKKLADSIHETYKDLKIIPKYVVPQNKVKEDWKPREIETGVGIWGI